MDTFNLFDPRYQLESEERAPRRKASEGQIHAHIQQALAAIDTLAAQLRQRAHDGKRPHH